MESIKESDLYLPIKDYLESLGYDTKGEVKSCDITAVKEDELIVVELKKGFTLDLIYQALERQKYADGVYIAVPLPKKGYMDSRYNNMLYLCRRLEIGLIFVGFSIKGKPQIDVALPPTPVKAVRRSKKKRLAVITEHNGRTGSVNTGGVTRRKIITVYKEQALQIAALLNENGAMKAADVRKATGVEKTSTILNRNFYKWYEKAEDLGNCKTTYKITQEGKCALKEYYNLLK